MGIARIVAYAAVALASATATAEVVERGSYKAEVADSGVKKISSLTGAPVEVTGTRAELIAKAQTCVTRNVSNAGITLSGADSGSFFGSMVSGGGQKSEQVQGGQLIELVDPENGLLVANSRVDFRRALLGYSAASTLTVEAKDGKFRIVQTNLAVAQKSTGSMNNSGYDPVVAVWGTGWEATLDAMQGVADKVAVCMSAGPADSEW